MKRRHFIARVPFPAINSKVFDGFYNDRVNIKLTSAGLQDSRDPDGFMFTAWRNISCRNYGIAPDSSVLVALKFSNRSEKFIQLIVLQNIVFTRFMLTLCSQFTNIILQFRDSNDFSLLIDLKNVILWT